MAFNHVNFSVKTMALIIPTAHFPWPIPQAAGIFLLPLKTRNWITSAAETQKTYPSPVNSNLSGHFRCQFSLSFLRLEFVFLWQHIPCTASTPAELLIKVKPRKKDVRVVYTALKTRADLSPSCFQPLRRLIF